MQGDRNAWLSSAHRSIAWSGCMRSTARSCSMLMLYCALPRKPMSSLDGQALQVAANSQLRRVSRAGVAIATLQAMVATGVLMWGLAIVHDRYFPVVAIDFYPGPRCLDPRFFLVDRRDQRIGRGDYVVFRSRGMGPFYPDGTLVIKRVA